MSTPTLLDTVTASSPALGLTSNSVSPTANRFLVALMAVTAATVGTKLPFSISNTLGLTFTKQGEHEYIDVTNGNTTSCVIYTAPLGGSPGSGTVTVNGAANANRRVLWIVEVDTFNITTPVKQEKGGTPGTASPHVITFDNTPDSDSLVLAMISIRGTTVVTGDSDYTQLVSTSAGSLQVAHLQYDSSPPDATVQWTPNAGIYSSCAIEIDAASTNTTDLDLVSYSSLINDITILESEIIPLDLVSYSSVENDLTILENELVMLDLVSYSSAENDITIQESEITQLDLVSYSLAMNELTILESEIIPLDLVGYSYIVNDASMAENEDVLLDLIMYSSVVNDISVLESEIVSLDLVSYSWVVNDLTILESETTQLDLVSYSFVVNDVSILSEDVVSLDLVSYSSSINDITILESEQIQLDLVLYSSIVNDLIVEDMVIALDLVLYSIAINDIIFIGGELSTPIDRCYAVLEEFRFIEIPLEKRISEIGFEERSILIQ